MNSHFHCVLAAHPIFPLPQSVENTLAHEVLTEKNIHTVLENIFPELSFFTSYTVSSLDKKEDFSDAEILRDRVIHESGPVVVFAPLVESFRLAQFLEMSIKYLNNSVIFPVLLPMYGNNTDILKRIRQNLLSTLQTLEYKLPGVHMIHDTYIVRPSACIISQDVNYNLLEKVSKIEGRASILPSISSREEVLMGVSPEAYTLTPVQIFSASKIKIQKDEYSVLILDPYEDIRQYSYNFTNDRVIFFQYAEEWKRLNIGKQILFFGPHPHALRAALMRFLPQIENVEAYLLS